MPLTNYISELIDDPANLLELITELRKRGYTVEWRWSCAGGDV